MLSISRAQLKAMATRLTCVGRINKLDSDTSYSSLVLYKLLQLMETPSCYHAIKMLVPCLCPGANIFKLFHAYYAAIVPFSFFDKLFRKNMVFMSDPSVFMTRKPFKTFFSSWVSFGLQACSYSGPFLLKLHSTLSLNLQCY